MIIVIYLFLTLGIGLILWGVFGHTLHSRRLKLPEPVQPAKKVELNAWLSRILPFTRQLLEKVKLEAKIKNKLDAAHIKMSAQAFFNLKILLMALLVIFSLALLGKAGPIALLVALAIGYIIPDIYLNRKISQRKYQIARLLPETVDLLGLCVEAGLDFTTALNWVIEKVRNNPLIDEFKFVLEEIKWGKSRTHALKDMAKRINIPEVSSFVQALVQAERMGTPVAEAFMIISEDTRLQRFHRGERFAMQAPIKILVPLIFCILPVIAIIVGGPIFLQFMQGNLFKGFGG